MSRQTYVPSNTTTPTSFPAEIPVNTQIPHTRNRREFLRGLSIAGAAGLLGLRPGSAAAEPPPEITTIRLIRETEFAVLCYAPQYIAEEFLRMEGFTDVRYVPKGVQGSEVQALIHKQADMSAALGVDWIMPIADRQPVVVLGGLHAGCIEVFASDKVQSIRELKGKRLAVHGLESPERFLLASVVAYIGLDPDRDIEWVFAKPNDWTRLLTEGRVDAIITFPPLNHDLRARKIGHVILNTTTDNPWRHYFCCMVGARREFVQNNPIATKRALRAIFKANQLCSLEPQRMAQRLVDSGQAANYDYALQTLRDIPYQAWRDYDPADTLRFYSLRLHEAGLIKRTPQEIISQGTDWRYFNQLKKELKV